MKHAMPPVDGPSLGLALRLFREKAGFTQQDLANALNRRRPNDASRVHTNTVSRWEKTGRVLTTDLLEILVVLDASGAITGSPDDEVVTLSARDERRIARLLSDFVVQVDRTPQHRLPADRFDEQFRALQDQIASLHHLIESSDSN